MSITARALHYVFKIGDRSNNADFFRDILGMKVLRHEEFTQGCEAQCNGPYDNRWSKTMVGYGPESSHFVIELTYNYGVDSYVLGNDFGGLTIQSKEILARADEKNILIGTESGQKFILSPDGYKFHIIEEPQPKDKDPILQVKLNSNNLINSKKYWNEILNMNIIKEEEKKLFLSYGEGQATLVIQEKSEPIKRQKAYGRIAFAVPYKLQPIIDELIRSTNNVILVPLIDLDTPDKAKVRVIVLADPDGHEICFVDEEGFNELSEADPEGNDLLNKYIKNDPTSKRKKLL